MMLDDTASSFLAMPAFMGMRREAAIWPSWTWSPSSTSMYESITTTAIRPSIITTFAAVGPRRHFSLEAAIITSASPYHQLALSATCNYQALSYYIEMSASIRQEAYHYPTYIYKLHLTAFRAASYLSTFRIIVNDVMDLYILFLRRMMTAA